MAVATGVADVVVCYRAFNERSGQRFGQVMTGLAGAPTSSGVDASWSYPMGLGTPAAWVAMIARRYMHVYGATSADFGAGRGGRPQARGHEPERVLLRQADHAGRAPGLALDRRAAAPARLLPGERRRRGDRRHERRAGARPAAPAGVDPGRRAGQRHRPVHDDVVLPRRADRAAGDGHRRRSSCGRSRASAPDDVDVAVLYDHFTPFVLIQLEELGFCPRGEARHFIADGALELGGRLPLNPNGGQLGEAYIHGMNGIAEGVRQVRGSGGQPGRATSSTSSSPPAPACRRPGWCWAGPDRTTCRRPSVTRPAARRPPAGRSTRPSRRPCRRSGCRAARDRPRARATSAPGRRCRARPRRAGPSPTPARSGRRCGRRR